MDQPDVGADGAIETILDAAADVLGITGSCWHRTDPASGLPIASAMLGEPAGSLEESLIYEFRRPDLNRFEELRSRRSPVAAISTETGGEIGASARFREMIEPTGSADELRAAFVDPFGLWAALAIFTERPMTPDDLEFVARLIPWPRRRFGATRRRERSRTGNRSTTATASRSVRADPGSRRSDPRGRRDRPTKAGHGSRPTPG